MEPRMNLEFPLVSVMMPTFNVEEYVEQAIESVLSQTYSNFELVIVDDGSTDKTPTILANCAKNDSRVKVYYSEHAGRGKTRNSCLEYSQGKYIAICDSDDVSFPERFERQVMFLETNPNIGAVGAQLCSFNEEPIFEKSRVVSWPVEAAEVAYSFRKGRMRIANCAGMIRSSLFKRYGNYNEQLNRGQDYDFFRRVSLQRIDLINLPEVLVFYRQKNIVPSLAYFMESEIYRYYVTHVDGLSFNEFEKQTQTKFIKQYLHFKYLVLTSFRASKWLNR